MTYVLNNTNALAGETAKSDSATRAPSVWQRFYAALVESRRQSAMRELRARSYLVNEAEIVLGGFPQTALKNDAALPFNR